MTIQAYGQPIFSYDQQSSMDEVTLPGGPVIQQLAPYGQSFTPSFTSVSFIKLMLYDNDPNNGAGATLAINLRTNSITGPIIASTASVPLTNGFAGVVTFQFGGAIPLTPESIYFFDPQVLSGDLWNVVAGEYSYPRGQVFAFGLPAPASDLWFREGIVVPEPSSVCLALVGAGFLVWWRRRHGKRSGAPQ